MIEKVTDKISMVMTEDGFLYSNTVLVEDDIRLSIDSGAGKIIKTIKPESINILLISHHHLDHINGNDHFTAAEILAHPIEKAAMLKPEKTTATEGWSELMDDDVMNYVGQLGGVQPRILEPWRVDKELADNQVIDCGKTKIIVLYTPGHTAGHCSFYFPEEEFIFTGDICLTEAGPWYGDPDVNVDDFIKSIDAIIKLKPKILATAHVKNLVSEDINSKLINYRDRIYKRERRILKFLEENPATINEIADKKLIYKMHPTAFVLFWEKMMVKKHLERLLEQGLIEAVENNRYRAVV